LQRATVSAPSIYLLSPATLQPHPSLRATHRPPPTTVCSPRTLWRSPLSRHSVGWKSGGCTCTYPTPSQRVVPWFWVGSVRTQSMAVWLYAPPWWHQAAACPLTSLVPCCRLCMPSTRAGARACASGVRAAPSMSPPAGVVHWRLVGVIHAGGASTQFHSLPHVEGPPRCTRCSTRLNGRRASSTTDGGSCRGWCLWSADRLLGRCCHVPTWPPCSHITLGLEAIMQDVYAAVGILAAPPVASVPDCGVHVLHDGLHPPA
jgi:hypothetical protein